MNGNTDTPETELREKIKSLQPIHPPHKYSQHDRDLIDIGAAGMRTMVLELLEEKFMNGNSAVAETEQDIEGRLMAGFAGGISALPMPMRATMRIYLTDVEELLRLSVARRQRNEWRIAELERNLEKVTARLDKLEPR